MNIYDYISAMIFAPQISPAAGCQLADSFFKSCVQVAFFYRVLLPELNGGMDFVTPWMAPKTQNDMVEQWADLVKP